MNMKEDRKLINCIEAPNMRQLVTKANSLGIEKDDIIQFFYLGG